MLSKKKPKNLGKNLSATHQIEIDLLVNKLEYTNNKKPSKPSLPNVLEPFKLLLLMDFSESCLHQFSRSHNTTLLHPPSITGSFLENSQSFPSSKTLSTLFIGVTNVWIQISSQGMTMEEERRRGYNDFSLRMSSSLSKGGCVMLQKPIQGFLSEQPTLLL